MTVVVTSDSCTYLWQLYLPLTVVLTSDSCTYHWLLYLPLTVVLTTDGCANHWQLYLHLTVGLVSYSWSYFWRLFLPLTAAFSSAIGPTGPQFYFFMTVQTNKWDMHREQRWCKIFRAGVNVLLKTYSVLAEMIFFVAFLLDFYEQFQEKGKNAI